MRIYKRNFISQVVVRADFQVPFKAIKESLPDGFLDEFRADFPVMEERDTQTQEVMLKVQHRQHEVRQKTSEPFKTWVLRSEDGTQKLELCQDFVSFSASTYTRYSSFISSFLRALDTLVGNEDVAYRRLGLRYIDEVRPGEGKTLEWDSLIAPELTGSLAFVGGDRFLRSMGVIEVEIDGCRMRMQYGMPNPDYPAPAVDRLFVIDCDAYIPALIEHRDLVADSERLNRLVYDYFERAIGDGLREMMEPQEVEVLPESEEGE